MNHTQLIQQLIDDNGYQSYLEIGYGTGVNFNAINVKNKIAVDPETEEADIITFVKRGIERYTSDEYFAQLDGRKKFDIVFVDGLHHAYQVERDIINSMKHLKKGGVIVVHDINPDTIEMQEIPRRQRIWTGDVWRAWVGFKIKYPQIAETCTTLMYDFGIGLLPYTKEIIEPGFSTDMLVDYFFDNKIELLNAYEPTGE